MRATAAELGNCKRVRVIHLAGHTGRLQAIFSAHHIWMLRRSRLTKRNLEPIANYNTAGYPILKLRRCFSLIDKSLLEAPFLEIRNNVDFHSQQILV